MGAEKSAGLFFVAFMFIGAGIGLLFGRPDVGGAIGMGVGFLAMAFIKLKYGETEVKKEAVSEIGNFMGTLIISMVGVMFILAGIVLLLGIEIPWRTVGGIVALAMGIVFLLAAYKIRRLSS